ncbi:hypothetical protein D3C76_994110 [compost metagenome]
MSRPAICPGRYVRVVAVVFAHRQGDEAEEAGVSSGGRLIHQKQRATDLRIANPAFLTTLRGAWQASVDVYQWHDELWRAQSSAHIGKDQLAPCEGVYLEVCFAIVICRPVVLAIAGHWHVEHA